MADVIWLVEKLQPTSQNSLGSVACREERRDAAENRERILDTAETLFVRHGVASVNMVDIAQAASVGKGTLYRHFSSKAALCIALMDKQLEGMQNTMLADLVQMRTRSTPYLEQLQHFLRGTVHFTEAHTPLLCEIQREGVLGGIKMTAPHFVWQHLTVAGLLRAAIRAGEIPACVDVEVTVAMLLAPLNAHFFAFLRNTQGLSLERVSEGLCRLVASLATMPHD